MKRKNDIFPTFKQWKALTENRFCKKIKRLCIDNGLKFYGGQFNEFYENEDIVRHHTMRKTPQQNGVEKCMNRSFLGKISLHAL